MPTKILNFRVDDELADAIGSAAAHRGQSKTEFARRAFRAEIARTWGGRVEVGGESSGKAQQTARSQPDGELAADLSPDVRSAEFDREYQALRTEGHTDAYARAVAAQRVDKRKRKR